MYMRKTESARDEVLQPRGSGPAPPAATLTVSVAAAAREERALYARTFALMQRPYLGICERDAATVTRT